MNEYLIMALIFAVIIGISISLVVIGLGATFKALRSKNKYFAAGLLIIIILSLGWYFNKHTASSVIADFEEVANIKVPKKYETVRKENSYLLVIDQMALVELQLERESINNLIQDIQKAKNYLPSSYFSFENYSKRVKNGIRDPSNKWTQNNGSYYLFSGDKNGEHFMVGLDSTRRTLCIQKNWSLF